MYDYTRLQLFRLGDNLVSLTEPCAYIYNLLRVLRVPIMLIDKQ